MNSKRETLKSIIQLALPAVIQQILSMILQYVDTAMVGHLGEAATASVSTSGSVNFFIHSIPAAFSVGILSLLSQAYGRKDQGDIKKISVLNAHLTIWFGLGLTVICLAIAPYLPVWMQADPAIRSDASGYFFIVSLSMLFSTASYSFANTMHAVKDTRTPMIINISANVMNVVLNYLLIYTAGMGVKGAAWATTVSTVFGGIAMMLAWRKKVILQFTREDYFKIDRPMLGRVMLIALPVMVTTVFTSMGHVVFSAMINGMGVTVFASHAIAITAEQIFYLPGFGIRTAASALIGIAIGEQNEKKFKDTRNLTIIITIAIMFVTGLILFFAAEYMMRIFTGSEAVIKMGAEVLRIVALSEPFYGLMIAWEGIGYGTGRTKHILLIEALSMWGIRILATSFVIRAGGSLNEVWYCMVADNICKATGLTFAGFMQNKKIFIQQKTE